MRWTLLLALAVIIAVLVLSGIVLIGVAVGGVGLAISIGVTILLGLGADRARRLALHQVLHHAQHHRARALQGAARRSPIVDADDRILLAHAGCQVLMAVIIQIAAS